MPEVGDYRIRIKTEKGWTVDGKLYGVSARELISQLQKARNKQIPLEFKQEKGKPVIVNKVLDWRITPLVSKPNKRNFRGGAK